MSSEKVIEIARLELGVTEEPVNRVKYNDAYYGRTVSGSAYPWCVVFLWWVFQEAQERMAFFGGGRTASCGTLLRWYKEQGLTVPVAQVKVGDIVILNFSGTKETQHCGLVTGKSDIINLSTGMPYSIWTIEGNTSPSDGSQSNGGMVCEKTRYPSQVVGVCRPQYKPEEPEKIDDITGHWYTRPVNWALEQGLIEGYPDGSFKPNNPLTRAEACAMAERLYNLIERVDDGK